MQGPIYLDYNATTPVDPEVTRTVEMYLRESYGNPSSAHAYGRRARVLAGMGLAADRARGAVRLSVGLPTTEEEIEHAASALVAAWQAEASAQIDQVQR